MADDDNCEKSPNAVGDSEPVGWRVFNMENDMTMNIVETEEHARLLCDGTDWSIEPVYPESRIRHLIQHVFANLIEEQPEHGRVKYGNRAQEFLRNIRGILVMELEELVKRDISE